MDIWQRLYEAARAVQAAVSYTHLEYQRGMKAMTLPAHDEPTCRDVLVKCIKFVLPEDLDVSGGDTQKMCIRYRYYPARTRAGRPALRRAARYNLNG